MVRLKINDRMTRTIFTIAFLAAALQAGAQSNTGIGTMTPGSRLTVNGSLGHSYSSTTTDYNLTELDYFVEYAGTGHGNIYLPVAMSGSSNFQGRIYKIKNSSPNPLAIAPVNGETVNGNSVIIIAAGHTAEVMSTGATTGSTWDLLKAGALTYQFDGIRDALQRAGCASCARYDAAATDTWVDVSPAEFTAVGAMTGMNGYGASAANMSMTRTNGWSSFTVGPNTSDMTQFPAATYPVGFEMQSGSYSNLAGIKLKFSTTSASSGFNPIPASGAVTPGLNSGNSTLGQNYYFILKKSSTPTSAGSASFIGFYSPSGIHIGNLGSSTNVSYGVGDVSSLGSATPVTNLIRVIGTATKQW